MRTFRSTASVGAALAGVLLVGTMVLDNHASAQAGAFIRSDSNASGDVDIADPVETLFFVFVDGDLVCRDAADSNDDGAVSFVDALHTLVYLFLDGAPPPTDN